MSNFQASATTQIEEPICAGTTGTAERSRSVKHHVVQLSDNKWNVGWRENTSRLHYFIADVSTAPPGMFFLGLRGSGLIALELRSDIPLNKPHVGFGSYCCL